MSVIEQELEWVTCYPAEWLEWLRIRRVLFVPAGTTYGFEMFIAEVGAGCEEGTNRFVRMMLAPQVWMVKSRIPENNIERQSFNEPF